MKHVSIILIALASTFALGQDVETFKKRLDDGQDPAAIKAEVMELAAAEDATVDLLVLAAQLCVRTNDGANALKMAEKALAVDPESADANYQMAAAIRTDIGRNQMRWMGEFQRYLGLLDKALEHNPKHESALTEKALFMAQAPPMVGGSPEKALELAERLEAVNPKDGLLTKAQVYAAMRDSEKVNETYQTLMEKYPEDMGVRFNYGMNLQGQGNYEKAVEQLTAVVEDPDYTRSALYQVAKTRLLMKADLDKALAELDRYIEIVKPGEYPSAADAMWRKGNIYEVKEDIEAAKAAYQKTLEMQPDHPQATQSLNQLSGE